MPLLFLYSFIPFPDFQIPGEGEDHCEGADTRLLDKKATVG